MSYDERHCIAEGAVLEAAVHADGRYRLRWGRPGAWRVLYEDGRRVVQGEARDYAFRSIEQLRYDFERDCADATDPA